ncbi:formate dehydrogenase accessory sulfurtransferase FdhD [Stenotrophomonas maltophilia]|uniref:formate dehydrogenase accessory sulfurtransferase FdhD n=1 Tax=Stenotrophomonas maltophilia TaxID=40324 RepID=UPI002894B128|nr:formate dehydrogenase accessory sulfurtransferase FdhD [Stenotrophomonas maltophilia]MDT3487224.1 formate dehydrogenase accessory sulfurtransferase FdhD [Stenotrophomonas maltophilia]
MFEPSPVLARDTDGIARRRTIQWRGDVRRSIMDSVAEEVPVAMLYNDVAFSVMMSSPANLEDFALGFSLTEGLIADPAQLLSVEVRPRLEGMELAMTVTSDAPVLATTTNRGRNLPGRSGCGICGASQLEEVLRTPTPLDHSATCSAASVRLALASLKQGQPMNAAAGSTHAAAWADPDGRILQVREDVGRHNALDKLIGSLARRSISTRAGILVLSSRASYEMVSKAASAGMAIVAAVSAPTALAIDLAKAAGICLVGFARSEGFNVYSHPSRLLELDSISLAHA